MIRITELSLPWGDPTEARTQAALRRAIVERLRLREQDLEGFIVDVTVQPSATPRHAAPRCDALGAASEAGVRDRDRHLRPLPGKATRDRAHPRASGARMRGGRIGVRADRRAGATAAGRAAVTLSGGVCRPDQPGSRADRARCEGGRRHPSSRCAVDERGSSPSVGLLKALPVRPWQGSQARPDAEGASGRGHTEPGYPDPKVTGCMPL